jgi:hypothetical protein
MAKLATLLVCVCVCGLASDFCIVELGHQVQRTHLHKRHSSGQGLGTQEERVGLLCPAVQHCCCSRLVLTSVYDTSVVVAPGGGALGGVAPGLLESP